MIGQSAAPWEARLLALAYEALDGHHPVEPLHADRRQLQQAYQVCTEITRSYSRTFFLASGLLPVEKRRAARALYAFCRISDNLVDVAPDSHAALKAWRRMVLSSHPPAGDPVALAWADTRARYRIPLRYAEQLIDGVARDLAQSRYTSFEDLSAYCYGVASTVGLMAMHITGFQGPEAVPYALKLGVALQLTNILRDIGEDWLKGRFYLPLDELAAFGLTEADIAAGRVDARWQAFLDYQIQRARRLYAESMQGIVMLESDGRLAIYAAAALYRAILDDITAHQGDVFNRRAHLSGWGKIARLPHIWWQVRKLKNCC